MTDRNIFIYFFLLLLSPPIRRLAAVPSVLIYHEADGQVPFSQDQEDAIQERQATAARARGQDH